MSLLFLLATLGCRPDDVGSDTGSAKDSGMTGENGTGENGTGENGGGDSDPNTSVQDITGNWLSEGDNVADLLASAPYYIVRVEATFNTDGSYLVSAQNQDGASADFTGTYTVSTATLPGTITLSQANPSTATAEGIWEVDGDTLMYEVVQTSPSIGATPPTPEGGFGSTQASGVAEGANVQLFTRQ